MKTVKYIKIFKIRGPSCFIINVRRTQSPKDDLLKSLEFEFRVSFWFLLHFEKNVVKLSVKAGRHFEMIMFIESIRLVCIRYISNLH